MKEKEWLKRCRGIFWDAQSLLATPVCPLPPTPGHGTRNAPKLPLSLSCCLYETATRLCEMRSEREDDVPYMGERRCQMRLEIEQRQWYYDEPAKRQRKTWDEWEAWEETRPALPLLSLSSSSFSSLLLSFPSFLLLLLLCRGRDKKAQSMSWWTETRVPDDHMIKRVPLGGIWRKEVQSRQGRKGVGAGWGQRGWGNDRMRADRRECQFAVAGPRCVAGGYKVQRGVCGRQAGVGWRRHESEGRETEYEKYFLLPWSIILPPILLLLLPPWRRCKTSSQENERCVACGWWGG